MKTSSCTAFPKAKPQMGAKPEGEARAGIKSLSLLGT